MRETIQRLIDKFTSGRWIATLFIVSTYCIVTIMVICTACELLKGGKADGKEILSFMIGSFTGTAMGAIIGYFFKDRQKGGQQ